jgi:hypothetical protein
MNPIGRRIRAAVNPVSTAVTRWWCLSAMRHLLTGYGPPVKRRRLVRREMTIRGRMIRGAGFPPSAAGHPRPAARHLPSAEQMKARATAIDELLAREET